MAQECTPTALVNAASCFSCLTLQQLLWLRIYLLCQINQGGTLAGILGEQGENILDEGGGGIILEE